MRTVGNVDNGVIENVDGSGEQYLRPECVGGNTIDEQVSHLGGDGNLNYHNFIL